MKSFVVHSSSGEYIADAKTGKVLEADSEEKRRLQPLRFNVKEFVNYYGKLDSEIDICDIGFVDREGDYEPPGEEFREHATFQIDKVQFPRLIAEANMAGLFDTEAATLMLDSMDITREDLDELIARANKKFEKHKKHYTGLKK